MKKRILLVDGDVSTRESLLWAFEMENYQVLSASNEEEALDLVADTLVDLALLNLQMLVQHGWELFERLIRENPLLPVLIITPQSSTRGAVVANRGGERKRKSAARELLQTVRDLLSEPAQVGLARMAQKLARTRDSYAASVSAPQLS